MSSKYHLREMIGHREMVYASVLDNLIAGRESPEHVLERWKKLKQVKTREKRRRK